MLHSPVYLKNELLTKCTLCTIIEHMTLAVSVSELRNNMSGYLERVMKGTRILIRDQKRNVTIAQITQAHLFDKSMYEKMLRKAAGILSGVNHPEWSTKSKIIDWIAKGRRVDERQF